MSHERIFEFRRRPLFPQGPLVTPVGFGGYRIGLTERSGYPQCAQALEKALRDGVNLIDTSANYGDGQSEQLIGHILNALFSSGELTRSDVTVVSKVGYIQGSNMDLAIERELAQQPFLEVSKFGNDVWHSIHPDFIFDQCARSLARLNLSHMDVYLLHNPEYMLKRFELDGVAIERARELFYVRVEQSFRALEELVRQGKISYYGVSSNTFGAPDDEYSCVSLKRIHEIAQSISPDHKFRVVQMPFNWIEVSPLFYEIENTGESCISYAQKNGIGVLLNRPLNAMFNNGLIRLTRPQVSEQQRQNMSPAMKQGLANWTQLAADMERLAKEQLGDVPGYQDAPLSQLVLATLAWIPGVSSVLCGMRQPHYVDDARDALARPALPYVRECLFHIYENLEFKHSANHD